MGLVERKTVFGFFFEQQRFRPACAFAQSDQPLYYSLTEKNHTRLATSEISPF